MTELPQALVNLKRDYLLRVESAKAAELARARQADEAALAKLKEAVAADLGPDLAPFVVWPESSEGVRLAYKWTADIKLPGHQSIYANYALVGDQWERAPLLYTPLDGDDVTSMWACANEFYSDLGAALCRAEQQEDLPF